MTTPANLQPPDFDALYAGEADPWQVESSWYERRKRAVLLASLPKERYASVWEPGCGIGACTQALAERCDHVIASDSSLNAVRRTRERTAHLSNVDAVVSAVPEVPLRGPVELLVVAEFLYYLADPAAAIETLWSATAPGTHVVVQHWAHDPDDAYVSGPEAHQLVGGYAASQCARRLVTHQEDDFLLDVYEVTQ
jgi:trans-aconitate methyltransferase